MNLWAYNANVYIRGNLWGRKLEDHWKTMNVKRAGEIPLFLDSWWPGGAPAGTDAPPAVNGPPAPAGNLAANAYHIPEMPHFCIDRHSKGTINGVFMDSSVRKLGLKQLWKLRWHRNWKEAEVPEWPDWMKEFKDY